MNENVLKQRKITLFLYINLTVRRGLITDNKYSSFYDKENETVYFKQEN